MIASTKNPRIVTVRKLTQRKYRLRQDRFLVEGLQLLGMAMQVMAMPGARARIKPCEVFYSQALFTGKTAPDLLAKLIEAGAEAISVAPDIIATISERDTPQGLVATFSLSKLALSLDELDLTISPNSGISSRPTTSPLLVVLDQLQDPGNLGTLIRTADAVAAQAVILLEPCVDPFDPKTVRSTMGSLFTIPFARTQNLVDLLARLSQAGYRLVGADGQRGIPPWQDNILAGPVALILGNEARGLSPDIHQHLTDYVSLPLHGHAESLNVAIAGGVLMYEWLRVNN